MAISKDLFMRDWQNIDYLASGNDRQKKAYHILSKMNIMAILKEFDPILVGTIPLGIDIPGSDLDIICYAPDLNKFKEISQYNFFRYSPFYERIKDGVYMAEFEHLEMKIELYASPEPTTKQFGYRHMIVEDRILNLADDSFRDKIIQLKMKGLKTEPAFGKLLNMSNAYDELLELDELSDKDLKEFLYKNFT